MLGHSVLYSWAFSIFHSNQSFIPSHGLFKSSGRRRHACQRILPELQSKSLHLNPMVNFMREKKSMKTILRWIYLRNILYLWSKNKIHTCKDILMIYIRYHEQKSHTYNFVMCIAKRRCQRCAKKLLEYEIRDKQF